MCTIDDITANAPPLFAMFPVKIKLESLPMITDEVIRSTPPPKSSAQLFMHAK